MILYKEALEIIHAQGERRPLAVEKISLEEISGRICAEDIKAPMANQPFDNSAMDGFALCAEDLARATNDNPAMLQMIGHVAAGGEPATRAPLRGQCYEIMTGAPVPPGCDTVVPVEKTAKDKTGGILFRAAVVQGENVRRAGADFAIGDNVLEAGSLLEPGHVLALSTLGIGNVRVRRKARIGLISTGLEVCDDLSSSLKKGQIYNSTGPYLRALLPQIGIDKISLGTVADDAAVYKEKLRTAVKEGCDIILSTGAVSAGVHDFVPAVLKELGAKIFFHKVSIRPGKPVLFAQLPDNGPFFFGLPGNPVSTAVGLRFFVRPVLRAMQGLNPERPEYGILKEDYVKKVAELRFFLRASLESTNQGMNQVSIIPNQQSFMVKPFVQSDTWVIIPENINLLKKGEIVEFYR